MPEEEKSPQQLQAEREAAVRGQGYPGIWSTSKAAADNAIETAPAEPVHEEATASSS